ncbi:hypothetical protein BGX21_000134 [Mortierella sp. AD011]|nr:hypothetical protein BGX20_007722 [Mortierella sp. AD010]KAF9401948.1 hypothetical protein BGX21_000134 [Mortierella sp. AD011]
MNRVKGKPSLISNVSNAEPHSRKAPSPVELPEILTNILSYLASPTLASACQVSRLFHSIAAPLLWNNIIFDAQTASTIWQQDKGFRLGLIRYGRFIENICLQWASVQDGDMELIAENCTRLKSLDLTSSNVTVESLRVLIHSDPYKTLPGDVKKRKRKQAPGRRKGQRAGEDGDDESGEDDDEDDDDSDGDVNTKMAKYRSMTETETEQDMDCYNYESVGLEPSTATESEQEQQGQQQPIGPVLAISRSNTSTQTLKSRSTAKNQTQSISSVVIPPHRRAGTTRPAKFKGTKTQFPYHLERLVLNRCKELSGASCLAAVSLLGPQLKSLSLNHITDLEDEDLLKLMKNCPNLSEIALKGTEVTDNFLRAIAGADGKSDLQERKLESLNVDMTDTSHGGLVPLIRTSRTTMASFSCEHVVSADEILYAFIEDAGGGAVQKEKAIANTPLTKRLFIPNTVLTAINLSCCGGFSDSGFAALFEYATELMNVKLDICQVTDESLLILAKTNRKRMDDLGYGVPAAWHEHELAMEKVSSATRCGEESDATNIKVSGSDKEKTPDKSQGNKADDMETSSSARKIFTKEIVRGGLKQLSLLNCSTVTNKGLRAIVRSCVNLEELIISDCTNVSMEVFNGPWACFDLKRLDISDLCLNLESSTKSHLLEEEQELSRFPPIFVDDYNGELDFDEDGHYDYIVRPGRTNHGGGDSDDDDDDDDDNSDNSGNFDDVLKPISPTIGRNTQQQRHILREFYSKLGRFCQLVRLNMSYGDYRIRVRDGLDLILPGLQKNLVRWDMTRRRGETFGENELIWLGTNFGYGHEFTEDEDELERNKKMIQLNKAKRVSKLQVVRLFESALEEVDDSTYEWFLDQGIEIEDADDFDFPLLED